MLKQVKDILGGQKEIERHPSKQIPIEERLPFDKAHNIGDIKINRNLFNL